MATRSATARLEQRRAELDKLGITNPLLKEAMTVIPRGTGRDKLWYRSGQPWGKAYAIGLILRYEGLPIANDDPCFSLSHLPNQKRAWEAMQEATAEPSEEEPPQKKTAIE